MQVEDSEWTTYITKNTPTTDSVQETIDGLKDGTMYEVRALLMDVDFNKYDGELVKSSEVRTKCYSKYIVNKKIYRNSLYV